MQISSSISLLAILAVTVVFLTLAIAIIAAILVHSKKIKDSNYRFRLIFDNAFDSIILIDTNYKVIDANKALRKMAGIDIADIYKLSLDDLIAKDKIEPLKNEFAKCISSGIEYRGEIDLLNSKSKAIQTEVGAQCIKMNGEQFILASFRDIGERIQAANELKSKHAALNEVIAHVEGEKLKFRLKFAKQIEETIVPTIAKLTKPDGTISKTHYEALINEVNEMAAAAGGKTYALGKLTPREIEICNLLKAGKTSKDIAEALDISQLTVNKHRERIRRKLKITKKDVNLSTYLKNS